MIQVSISAQNHAEWSFGWGKIGRYSHPRTILNLPPTRCCLLIFLVSTLFRTCLLICSTNLYSVNNHLMSVIGLLTLFHSFTSTIASRFGTDSTGWSCLLLVQNLDERVEFGACCLMWHLIFNVLVQLPTISILEKVDLLREVLGRRLGCVSWLEIFRSCVWIFSRGVSLRGTVVLDALDCRS